MNLSVNRNGLLAGLLVSLFVSSAALAQSAGGGGRDPIYLNTLHIGGNDVRALEFGFGLFPPVKLGSAMWLNSISGQQWELNGVEGLPQDQIRFAQYRYTPMLMFPLGLKRHLTFGLPMTFAALEYEPRLRNDAYFNSLFMGYSAPSATDPDATWSLGLIVLDRAKRRQIFPTGSYSYFSTDKKWRFAFGFPFLAVTYLPNDQFEIGTFLGRETSQNFIPEDHPLAASGRYLDQEQSIVGLSARFHLPHSLKLNFVVGSMVDAKYKFLDSDFNEVSKFKTLRDLGYLKVGVSWAPAKKAAPAEKAGE